MTIDQFVNQTIEQNIQAARDYLAAEFGVVEPALHKTIVKDTARGLTQRSNTAKGQPIK